MGVLSIFLKTTRWIIVISTSYHLLSGAIRTTAHWFRFRQSATKWVETLPKTQLFYVLLASKEGNIAFPPPSPPCNVVLMFKLPIENSKHPNFEWRGQVRGGDCLFSELALFEYNVSTILRLISSECQFKSLRRLVTVPCSRSWQFFANLVAHRCTPSIYCGNAFEYVGPTRCRHIQTRMNSLGWGRQNCRLLLYWLVAEISSFPLN